MFKIIGGDQKEYGPITTDQLRQWIREGRANAQTLVRKDEGPWSPLASFPEFAADLGAPGAIPVTPQGVVPPGGPPLGGVTPLPRPGESPEQKVQSPAVGLLITGILCALASVFGMISNLMGGGTPQFPPEADVPPQVMHMLQMMSGPVGMILGAIQLAIGILIIYASQKMRRLESYGLVMAATILAILPCTSGCCCVGLPIGIWVLVVLSKSEVKAAFH